MGILSAKSVTAPKGVTRDWASNVATAIGALCFVLTLLLYSPGVRVAGAEDAPPESLASVDPAFDGTVDFSSLDSSLDAASISAAEPEPTAPACNAAGNSRSRQLAAVEHRIQSGLDAVRRAAQVPSPGIVMLNNRGYNYRSGGPGSVSLVEDPQALVEQLPQAR